VQMQKMLGVFRAGDRLAALLDLSAVLEANERSGKLLPSEEKGG